MLLEPLGEFQSLVPVSVYAASLRLLPYAYINEACIIQIIPLC